MFKKLIDNVRSETPPDYKALGEELKECIEKNYERDETIIRILGTRTCAERQKIVQAYNKAAYHKLESAFQGFFPSNFDNLVVQLCRTQAERDAYRAYNALNGWGTDEESLVKLLIPMTPDEITTLKETYKKLFSRLLVDDISRDTSSDFKDFLLTLMRKCPEDKQKDEDGYLSCANQLYSVRWRYTKKIDSFDSFVTSLTKGVVKVPGGGSVHMQAGESRIGTDSAKINAVLINTKPSYLREVFKYFIQLAEKDIEDSIRSETSGCYRMGLLNLITYIKSGDDFYAITLNAALNGWFMNHKSLQAFIVDRSEIDMEIIQKRYEELFQRSLEDTIYVKTSGSYRDLLIALIKQNGKKTQNGKKAG